MPNVIDVLFIFFCLFSEMVALGLCKTQKLARFNKGTLPDIFLRIKDYANKSNCAIA